MKILCDVSFIQNPLSAGKQNRYNRHIYNIGSIAQQLGHQVVLFNGQQSVSEIINNYQPELYISKLSSINKHILESNTKSAVFLDKDQKYLNFNPDLVATFNDHEYNGPHINQLPAVAATLHINGKYNESYSADLVYVGNRLTEKEGLFRQFLFPSFSKHKVRVYSSSPFLPWTKECLGQIEEEDKKSAYRSSKYCLHLPAQHISTRPFEILAAGGVCVSPHDESLKNIFEDRINYVFHGDDIYNIEIDEKTRKDNMKWIMMNHTYLQRWNEIYAAI